MHLLDHPLAYKLWQGPFAAQKLVPLQRRIGHGPYGRVLDVACGPGINTAAFAGPGYKGIDLNPHYIARATAVHGPMFEVADATTFRGAPGTEYDVVLINSFLHHLDDAQVKTVLDHVRTLLAPGGTIQIWNSSVRRAASSRGCSPSSTGASSPAPSRGGWRSSAARSASGITNRISSAPRDSTSGRCSTSKGWPHDLASARLGRHPGV